MKSRLFFVETLFVEIVFQHYCK